MRIVLLSERLRAPYDEGIKNVAANLVRALAVRQEVLALTSHGSDDERYGIQNVDSNRLLLSARLGRVIQRFRPQAILYLPTACGTLFSFARARVLKCYGRSACTVLVTLQPRHYTLSAQWSIRRLTPDLVLAQSRRTAGILEKLGCRSALLPPAVDTQRFCPTTPAEKAVLRIKHGVPAEARVVSHVGHLKGKRNLSYLLALQSREGYHTVVVGSTSTEQDRGLKDALRAAGATVVDTYLTSIEDIYRLSDAYVFLAQEDTAAIDVPLSVLEAMACNLPVVSTPFGGLPDFFPEGRGLLYWRDRGDLGEVVKTAMSAPSATRTLVEPYTWSAAARSVVSLVSTGRKRP